MIRVLLVDDQELVRSGFAALVSLQPDLEVVGESANGAEAVEAAVALRPDVVLMDIRMPVLDGIEATRRILASFDGDAPRVLVLTTFDTDDLVLDALRAGASGFLLKDAPPPELMTAIRVVARGDALLAPAITRRLIEEAVARPDPTSHPAAAGIAALTPKERDVLGLVAAGLSNAEIGERIYAAEATVKTHVGHILTKLDARDRVQLVILAYESGLVRPGDQG